LHRAIATEKEIRMTVRTLILTTGAIVALAAPAAVGAKGVPAKQAAAKHARVTKVAKAKQHGRSPVIYINVPGPLTPPAPPTALQVCGQENSVLSDYGFSQVDCSAVVGQTASADPSAAIDDSASGRLCGQENEVLGDYGFSPIACSILVGQTSSGSH
jgi:hypothetical protein